MTVYPDDYVPDPRRHVWDDDAVCIYCGFDGAEWDWIYRVNCHPEERRPVPPCERAPVSSPTGRADDERPVPVTDAVQGDNVRDGSTAAGGRDADAR